MNDVRDEALGTLLERAAVGIESAPVDGLHEALRRGGRRRAARFTVIGAAVAVFTGAVAWAGLTLPKDVDVIPADISGWRTFASLEENGWTVQVPPSWRVQELPSCPNAPERIGVIVTNTDFQFLNPRGESPRCEDRFLFQGFPSDGVALALMPVGIRFGIVVPQPDTVFPLSPDRLTRTDSLSGGASQSFMGIWEEEVNLAYVRRWVGPDASTSDVVALDRMLRSLQVRDAIRWTEKHATKITLHDEARGFTVTYPSTWIVADENLTPWLVSPEEILSIGTFPLETSKDPDGGLRLFDAPVAPSALADLTTGDALVSLQESSESVGPEQTRLEHFGPLGCQDAIFGCDAENWHDVPFRAWWIPFEDAGRQFYLFVAIGNEAPSELRDQAWAVAESLSFVKN